MADKEVHVGDKFIIEVDEVEWHPTKGNRYYIKGFDSLMMTDYGISKLKRYEEPPKEVPHTCENCAYKYCPFEESPCVMCDKNEFERRDMFEAMK